MRKKWYDFPRKGKWFSQRKTEEELKKYKKNIGTIASVDYILEDHGFHGIMLSFKESTLGYHPFLRLEDVPELLFRTGVDFLSEVKGSKVEIYHNGSVYVSLSVPGDK